MKYFTKYNKVFLILALVFMIGSCTKNFEEMNTNPNSPTDVPAINIFSHVLVNQVGRELGGWIQHTYLGCWSQQWSKVQYIDEDKYETRDMTGYTEAAYTAPLLDLQIVLNKTAADIDNGVAVESNTALHAAARIFRVWVFSYVTDLVGDTPYSEALQGLLADGIIASPYDTQENIYADFFAELEAANTMLNNVVNFGSGDVIFGGDPDAWKKFGNSLKLRLLNRVAGTPWDFTYNLVGTGALTTNAGTAAFSGADALIAAILNDPAGHPIMTSNDDNCKLDYPGLPYRNPIYNTLFSRTDQGMSETMVDFLNNRNDPRVHIYAQPTPTSVGGGTAVYVGHQNGLAHAAAVFTEISLIGTTVVKDENAPLYVLCYDEVEFIKAEYYMRASNPGSAQTAYEDGIAASMERWGCIDGGTVSPTYFDNEIVTMPLTFTVDYTAYLAQANVDFAAAADDGERYQRIIEQRWAAIFGQGVQAWNLVRRTGFPARVFEFELEDTEYPGLGLPVRIRYSLNEEVYNPANLTEALQRQNVETINDGMFSTSGTTSQMWWHTRKNPIPTDIDP